MAEAKKTPRRKKTAARPEPTAPAKASEPWEVRDGDTCAMPDYELDAKARIGSPRGDGAYAYVPLCEGHEAGYYDGVNAVRDTVANSG